MLSSTVRTPVPPPAIAPPRADAELSEKLEPRTLTAPALPLL
jgi:hypothetical protein